MRPLIFSLLGICFAAPSTALPGNGNSTYLNPVLPGWNSDPSCVVVRKLDDTIFCVTSSFMAFPGLPVYASQDLQHWKLVSNVFNRAEQVPQMKGLREGDEGFWAPTIRYHDGTLYVVATFVGYDDDLREHFLFSSSDPFDQSAWSAPLNIQNPQRTIDPDLFWDDDGTVYMASGWGSIYLSSVNLETGGASEAVKIWGGTGGRNPEAPHIYRKDGYYYLVIAEGGSGENHAATIARSKNITGPYESYEGNPLLTNRGTDELFQTVGHADLFQDSNGNWWGMALSTRAGPEFEFWPMGRESVLFPVRWDEGQWPVAEPVRGEMSGWKFPQSHSGHFKHGLVDSPEKVDFEPGSSFPKYWSHYMVSNGSSYQISPPGHTNSLKLVPSASNLTGHGDIPKSDGFTFIGRRQTATKFKYSVDLDFDPKEDGEEAGITVFTTQTQHAELAVAHGQSGRQLILQGENASRPNVTVETVTVDIPQSWSLCPIRLTIEAKDAGCYTFSARSSCLWGEKTIGSVSAALFSGGEGRFVGSLMGSYATSNGGDGQSPAFFTKWRYEPITQEITNGEFISV